MDRERILIVDDEELIRDIIKEYLGPEGYIVDEAGDGEEALDLFARNRYSFIILDIMMPKIDGWSVCREIRKTSDVPIIMLSARGEEYDKLFGFELGVDDYLVKPFSPKELLARIKAIMRRSNSGHTNAGEPTKRVFQGLVVEFDSRNVSVDGGRINLTLKEFDLLSLFVKNPNRVFTREQILNQVWGYDFFGDDRTVDTHIKMLRESLMGYRKFIVTVWGIGYKFEPGESHEKH
ncbi:MAG TPA: response regulator transcription factor [Clostridia bacterium]|nr:response regulator transcription factor [Clostridia bacterium]